MGGSGAPSLRFPARAESATYASAKSPRRSLRLSGHTPAHHGPLRGERRSGMRHLAVELFSRAAWIREAGFSRGRDDFPGGGAGDVRVLEQDARAETAVATTGIRHSKTDGLC